jgi:hypothetical protein
MSAAIVAVAGQSLISSQHPLAEVIVKSIAFGLLFLCIVRWLYPSLLAELVSVSPRPLGKTIAPLLQLNDDRTKSEVIMENDSLTAVPQECRPDDR